MNKIKAPEEWISGTMFPMCKIWAGEDRVYYSPHTAYEIAQAYHEYAMEAEFNDDKLFELAELLSDEVFGEKGVILYSERQELTVKFLEILKSRI
jgi:hypothetical protein